MSCDEVVEEAAVKTPVYPKNPEAPLCPCFGLTCEDVEQDIREGVVTRTRSCVERASVEPTMASEARCAIASPSGQSCVAEVQRYYMKRRSES